MAVERDSGGNVVPFRPASKTVPRICSLCEHSALGQFGVYCTEYKEHINNERVAEECGEWQPQNT